MKRFVKIFLTVFFSTFITGGLVYAAGMQVDWLRVGSQGVGGVTYFNGTIINTTTTNGADNPVTFGDNVRIDGRVYRGATAGPNDNLPFIVNDDMEIMGNLTLSSGKTLDVSGITLTGAATISSNWVNTAYPWAADEIADVTRRIELPLASFYTDADGTPATITSATVPNIAFTTNQGLAMFYSATETTDIGTQFTVPPDFASGGVFKVLYDTSGSVVTDLNVDFKVAISQTTGTVAWDTDMDNETAVDVAGTASTPRTLTLTPTDHADISAGDTIFFDVFPDTYGAGEPDLEIYGVWFEYTAVQ